MSVVDCHVCIIRGFFKIDHGNSTHHSDTYTYYILASRWMTIYLPFVIFVSMDEKTECRCLYFLVSILRGIIFIAWKLQGMIIYLFVFPSFQYLHFCVLLQNT